MRLVNRSDSNMRTVCEYIAWLVLAVCVTAFPDHPTQTVPQRFKATKAGVELTYQISYHVFGLKLMRIGEACSYSVEGELKNAEALLEQGNAIAATLRRMSGIYHGHKTMLAAESDFRVYFNVDGEVKPFAVESSKETFKGASSDF